MKTSREAFLNFFLINFGPAFAIVGLFVCFVSSSATAQSKVNTAQPAPPATQLPAHAMSLKEAVTAALNNNPSMSSAGATVDQAAAQVPVIRASILPNVNLIGTAGERVDALNASPKFGGDIYNLYNTDLRLTQPLFVFGSLSAVDAAKKDRDLRKLDLEIAGRNLTAKVVQAYFQVVLDMRNLDTLKRNQNLENEALGTAQRRERTGRGQTLDVLQIKTQLALLKSQIATAQNETEIASATLASLLGDQQAHQLRVKDRLDAPDLQHVDTKVDLAKFRLPELEQNKISVEQVDDQKSVLLGTNLPTLSAQADYLFSAYKGSDLYDQNASAWQLTLNLNIPIFSGLSSVYQQQALNAQRTKLEFDRQTIVNTTNLNQVSSRKQLETAEQSIIEGREALRLAVASFDEARRMFRLATIDFLQLLTIDQAYVQAESAFNNYKYNYIISLSNYYVNSGQDLNTLIDLLDGANL